MEPGKPDHWDPKPAERIWYRSTQTGDRGYLVVRDGVDKVRLDRPGEEIVRKLNDADWSPDTEYRPYTRYQVAQLCWKMDCELLRMMGRPQESRVEWNTLHEEKRIRFLKEGPAEPGPRSELWAAVMLVLEPLSR